MQGLGRKALGAHHGGLFIGIGFQVVGEHVHIGVAGLTALFLDARDVLLDLGLDLVHHEVDGGIHVGRLFGSAQVQPLAGDGHFTAMPELVHSKHNTDFQSGSLAKKAPHLFHAATGILLQMIGGLEVLESESNVHRTSRGAGIRNVPCALRMRGCSAPCGTWPPCAVRC